MKTALQTLIAWGDEMIKNNPSKILSFEEAIDKAEELLEMEKQQIERDFMYGYKNGNMPLNHKVLDKYYNETYKEDKQ